MKKLDIARKRQVRVDYYLDSNLRVNKVEDQSFYDKATILQVFDQNHFNLVIIEADDFYHRTCPRHFQRLSRIPVTCRRKLYDLPHHFCHDVWRLLILVW